MDPLSAACAHTHKGGRGGQAAVGQAQQLRKQGAEGGRETDPALLPGRLPATDCASAPPPTDRLPPTDWVLKRPAPRSAALHTASALVSGPKPPHALYERHCSGPSPPRTPHPPPTFCFCRSLNRRCARLFFSCSARCFFMFLFDSLSRAPPPPPPPPECAAVEVLPLRCRVCRVGCVVASLCVASVCCCSCEVRVVAAATGCCGGGAAAAMCRGGGCGHGAGSIWMLGKPARGLKSGPKAGSRAPSPSSWRSAE